jgi:hypothetical protein
MNQKPELYVPATSRNRPAGWRLTLLRIWFVLALIVAWVVLVDGDREIHFRAALYTLAAFYAVWRIAAWIFRPVLPPEDRR